jgi:hypothetical protein
MKHLALVLLIASCTHLAEREAQKKSWVGHRIEEVERHPIFSGLSRKERVPGKVTYANGGPHLSNASCQAVNCSILTEFWCEHTFSLKDGYITNYEQYGPCPYNKLLDPY